MGRDRAISLSHTEKSLLHNEKVLSRVPSHLEQGLSVEEVRLGGGEMVWHGLYGQKPDHLLDVYGGVNKLKSTPSFIPPLALSFLWYTLSCFMSLYITSVYLWVFCLF
jgi:hypothetical protein